MLVFAADAGFARVFYFGSKNLLRRNSDNFSVLPKIELHKGVRIHRAWSSNFGRSNLAGRTIDYVTFFVFSFVLMIKLVRKGDVLVAKTDPPLV